MPEAETENIKVLEITVPEELPALLMQETEVCGQHLTVREKGYSIHRLLKVISTWLFLKAESPGAGLIQNYTKQMPDLCWKRGISRGTFFTHMKQLEAMKLLQRKDGNIRVCTWDKLGEVLDIDTQKRTKIEFTYGTKEQLHLRIAALEIGGNLESCGYMVRKKMNKNSEEINSLWTALHRRGFDLSKVNEDPYLFKRLRMLYVEDFKSGTEVHDPIINMRPDLNRSCKGIGKAWNASPTVVSYWKAQMVKQKIIKVTKWDPIVHKWKPRRERIGEPGLNKFCNVVWSEKKLKRLLNLCDNIEILTPGEGINNAA